MKLRPEQIKIKDDAVKILQELNIVYLAMKMRTGKTLTSMFIAEEIGAKNVLFVTKKKAIASIEKDYQKGKFGFNIKIINYEQLHKLEPEYDLIIVDEAHGLGAFPKPSLRTKNLKEIVGRNKLILLSGTPTPESHSQIYHQFWISEYSPFGQWINFYKWAKAGFVDVRKRIISGYNVNDYSRGLKDKIEIYTKKYMLTLTQEQAGFQNHEIIENIKEIDMVPGIYALAKKLNKDKYYMLKDGNEIVCDSAAKLQSKLHQLYSGTIISESNNYLMLDNSKVKYIIKNYKPPYAIFYKYKSEGDMLKRAIVGSTDIPEEFISGEKDIYIAQIRTGALGIDLSRANKLIFFNIDFSAELYWQARARIQAFDKKELNEVDWLFSKNGIENKIYDVVKKKRNYTTYYFKKDFK